MFSLPVAFWPIRAGVLNEEVGVKGGLPRPYNIRHGVLIIVTLLLGFPLGLGLLQGQQLPLKLHNLLLQLLFLLLRA